MFKLALIGFAAALLAAPISATAGLGHRSTCSSRSEMVACGKQGVQGNRAQFVTAVTRPVGNRPFLWQLPH